MPLCAKCHQNQATIHFTTLVDGAQEEAVHLCKDCAPATGLDNLNLKELEALSVIGKKCEFCGRQAFSGITGSSSTIYWCYDCGLEFGRIFAELCASERSDLMQRSATDRSFLSICFDLEFQAWSDAATEKAARILREMRRQDGRDRGKS